MKTPGRGPPAAGPHRQALWNRGGGRYFIAQRGLALPDWAAEIDCASWAQILLKFVLSHPAVTCAIPGTSRPEHMRDDIAAGTGRMPDRALRERMAALAP